MTIEDIRADMSPRDKEVAALYVDMITLIGKYDRVNKLFDKLESIGDNNDRQNR